MPTNIYNMYQAKSQFSKLIQRVANGEEIIIAKAGVPYAKITKYTQIEERNPGCWEGQVYLADDFDAPLPDDILNAFHGIDDEQSPA